MLGIVIGTLCLIGFCKVAFGHRGLGRRFGHHGCGGHYGYHHGHRHGHGWGASRGLYFAFQRLDTSPGQEKAIRAALAELRETLFALRPNLVGMRREVGDAFSQDTFSSAQMDGILNGTGRALDDAKAALSGALGKIHEALDPDQRKRLASWLQSGPHAWCW